MTLPPLVRRCDVVDADLRVVMSGPAPEQLQPSDGTPLEPELAREVSAVVARHDFRRRPVATALVGTEYGLRVARCAGLGSEYYSVSVERIPLARQLRAVAAWYRLGAEEVELLRLLVGGYPESEIATRLELDAPAVRARILRLGGRLGCTARRELVALVFEPPRAKSRDAALRRAQ